MVKFVNNDYQAMSDEELAALIKSGDEASLRVLIERYFPIIKRETSKICFNGDDADFWQEGLMALYAATGVFNPQISSFKAFARVCIERSLISYLRKNYSKRQIPAEALVYFEDNFEYPSDETPESLIIEREESDLFSRRIKEELSEQEYKILLAYLSGSSYESIANKFGLSLKAVNNSMYRARKKIELLK